MAGRYGRNQRRRHREEIARLEDLLFGGWNRADEFDDAVLITGRMVRRFSDTTEGDFDMGVKRTAHILLYPGVAERLGSRLLDAYVDQGWIAYRGIVWRLMQMEAKRGSSPLGNEFELKLLARCRRRPS